MNREIKFRAWDTKRKKMVDQDYLDCHRFGFRLLLSDWSDDLVLMQFTGLKDKNGIEIYEGDIVIAGLSGIIGYDAKSVVCFQNGCFGIECMEDLPLVNNSLGKFKAFVGCVPERDLAVIGNICEHPELLTK